MGKQSLSPLFSRMGVERGKQGHCFYPLQLSIVFQKSQSKVFILFTGFKKVLSHQVSSIVKSVLVMQIMERRQQVVSI